MINAMTNTIVEGTAIELKNLLGEMERGIEMANINLDFQNAISLLNVVKDMKEVIDRLDDKAMMYMAQQMVSWNE